MGSLVKTFAGGIIMDDNLRIQIAEAFGRPEPYISYDDRGGCMISCTTLWNGRTLGISQCIMRLEGIDPLSGKMINSVNDVFNANKNYAQLGPLFYYGNFTMHFDAVCSNGSCFKDIVEAVPVELRCSNKKPYVKCDRQRKGEFIQFNIESNCWPFCKGRMWLKYGGHWQTPEVPASGNRAEYILPGNDEPELGFAEELRCLID